MSIQDAFLSSIETMIQNLVPNYIPQTDYECVVSAIKNTKYQVSINGGTYLVTNGVGIDVTVGMSVWVHVPNGNFGKAFIVGSKTNAISSGGGTSIEPMKGATATSDGESGAVPQPLIKDVNRFLCGDGTWKDVQPATEKYLETMPESGNTGDIVLLKY